MSDFVKHDSEKVRFELLEPLFIELMAAVLTLGAVKYSDSNWQKGGEKRYIGALYRHLTAHHKGELSDPESKLPHMVHVAVNAMFIWWISKRDN